MTRLAAKFSVVVILSAVAFGGPGFFVAEPLQTEFGTGS